MAPLDALLRGLDHNRTLLGASIVDEHLPGSAATWRGWIAENSAFDDALATERPKAWRWCQIFCPGQPVVLDRCAQSLSRSGLRCRACASTRDLPAILIEADTVTTESAGASAKRQHDADGPGPSVPANADPAAAVFGKTAAPTP